MNHPIMVISYQYLTCLLVGVFVCLHLCSLGNEALHPTMAFWVFQAWHPTHEKSTALQRKGWMGCRWVFPFSAEYFPSFFNCQLIFLSFPMFSLTCVPQDIFPVVIAQDIQSGYCWVKFPNQSEPFVQKTAPLNSFWLMEVDDMSSLFFGCWLICENWWSISRQPYNSGRQSQQPKGPRFYPSIKGVSLGVSLILPKWPNRSGLNVK